MKNYFCILFASVLLFAFSPLQGQVKLGIGDDNAQKQSTSATTTWSYSEVKGVVIDSLTRAPIESALVSVLTPNMAVRHAATDAKGRFSFKGLPKKNLKIEITCLGYKIFTAWPETTTAILDLGKIRIAPDVQQIDAVTVKTRMSFFTIRGDTIVYNPKAVRTLEGDMAADILRKMPGVEVQGGQVSIMGQEVRRTYVNGRPVYGQEGNKAIHYVEAKNVAGIEAYDEIDVEEYERTGEIRKRKAIDILTFDLFTQNIVGDAFINYGADTDKNMDDRHQQRYAAGGGFRFFTEKRQLELDATVDNTGLDRQDYGATYSSIGHQSPSPGYNRKTKAGVAYTYNKPMTQVQLTLPDGQIITQNKMESRIRASYNYEDDLSRQILAKNNIYFPSADYTSRLDADTSLNRSSSRQHRLALSYNSNEWLRAISTSFNFSDDRQHADRISLNMANGRQINRSRSQNNTEINRLGANFGMEYAPFYTKKHNLSGNFHISYGNDDTQGWRIDTLQRNNQKLNLTTPASTHNISIKNTLSYSYMTGKKTNISLSYLINYENTKLKSYSADRFTGIIDTTISRDYRTNQLGQSLSLEWRHNITQELLYSISAAPKLTLLGQDEYFPDYRPENRTFLAIDPIVSLYWMGGLQNIAFTYTSQGQSPSLDQLRDRLETQNPLWISVGNPNLKQAYNHSINLSYDRMNPKTQRSFSVSFHANLYRNQTVMQQTYLPNGKDEPQYNYTIQPGATLNRWVNVNGAYDFNVFIRVSQPIHLLKSRFHAGIKAEYSKSPAPIDNRIDFTKGFSPEVTLGLTTNFSSKFEAILNSRTGYRNMRNITGNIDHNILQQANVSFRYNPHRRIFINGSYEFYYNRSSFTPAFSVRNHLLDATVGCRFLKNNVGNLSVTVYDILNRNRNLTTTMNAQYISQSWQQVFGRYFTVNLSFKLNYKK